MGIKSDLPDDVTATVADPVYDTATGKFLLNPQDSLILGKYNSQVVYRHSRVQVVLCNGALRRSPGVRAEMPDGQRGRITCMVGYISSLQAAHPECC